MSDVTKFRLVLGNCIVHVVIFINNFFTKIVQNKLLGIAKDTHNDNFRNVGKIMPC